MLIHSLTMQTRKRLACDVFDAFVKRSSLVNDVTGTPCRGQNGSTYGRDFVDL